MVSQSSISEKKENNKTPILVAGAERAWLVVRPYRGKDRILRDVIRGKGFEQYIPVLSLKKRDRATNGYIYVPEAMFPGYILVRAPAGRAGQVFNLPYVAGVLPMALMDGVVRGIRSRERHGHIKQFEPAPTLQAGERVTALRGYVDAIVGEPLDTNRISLITGMFNGSARFICGIEHVIRCQSVG